MPDCVDPMQRRRLSTLAKASLWVAHQCVHDLSDVRMIYASQHGEVARTTEMLAQLAEQESISPTAFSMSVLNATLGFYSIVRGITAPATAISSGAETLGYALLEAHGQLQRHPDQPVLVVYADETVPTVWQMENRTPHALALLLQGNATEHLDCSLMPKLDITPAQAAQQTQAQAISACLRSAQPAHWQGPCHQWQWSSTAA